MSLGLSSAQHPDLIYIGYVVEVVFFLQLMLIDQSADPFASIGHDR